MLRLEIQYWKLVLKQHSNVWESISANIFYV